MTDEQDLLSGMAKAVFRLNGQLLAIGEELARPAGLTASWWLVLGSVLSSPRSVADIARDIGVTRQSVQRTADILVARNLAEFRANPAHRRAKLLAPTDPARNAIRAIAPAHRSYAEVLVSELGVEEAERMLGDLGRLSETLQRIGLPSDQLRSRG